MHGGSVLALPAGFAGSRSGALIASAWASLMHQGQEGYQAITKKLMEVGFACCLNSEERLSWLLPQLNQRKGLYTAHCIWRHV